jgi:NH3-dependent NAD+ synthetase
LIFKFPAAQQMHMQMKHHLPSVGVAIKHRAESAVGYFFYFGDMLRSMSPK